MTNDSVRNHGPAAVAVTTAAKFCGHCGAAISGTESSESLGRQPGESVHADCSARLVMEPPRYCAQCGRRMKVQVAPQRWTAECSRHGRIA